MGIDFWVYFKEVFMAPHIMAIAITYILTNAFKGSVKKQYRPVVALLFGAVMAVAMLLASSVEGILFGYMPKAYVMFYGLGYGAFAITGRKIINLKNTKK